MLRYRRTSTFIRFSGIKPLRSSRFAIKGKETVPISKTVFKKSALQVNNAVDWIYIRMFLNWNWSG